MCCGAVGWRWCVKCAKCLFLHIFVIFKSQTQQQRSSGGSSDRPCGNATQHYHSSLLLCTAEAFRSTNNAPMCRVGRVRSKKSASIGVMINFDCHKNPLEVPEELTYHALCLKDWLICDKRAPGVCPLVVQLRRLVGSTGLRLLQDTSCVASSLRTASKL